MNFKMITYILGWTLNIIAGLMLVPFLVSLYYGEASGKYFLICAAVMVFFGFHMVIKRPESGSFYSKDGLVTTALSWILLSVTGCLPFYLSGAIPKFEDALFECISGFTTTGASILSEVESLDRCMGFWRCFIQLIGGMGVLVFLLALIPVAGGQSIFLMKAESPGPDVGKLAPKVKQTAYYLYIIYFVLVILQIICYLLAKMPFYDAVCTACTAASTGGFSVKNASIAAYSPAIQYITATFLFLYGMNYNFFFLLWIKRFREAFSMEEIRLYVLFFWGSVFAIMANLISFGQLNGEECFRHSFFQVSSIMTTAGFATANYDIWPALSKEIIVLLMFVGGCAGSTCGGIKVSRILIYLKTFVKEIGQLTHPRKVKIIKIDGKALAHAVLRNANIFLIVYTVIFLMSVLLVSGDNFDMVTNFTAVASAIGNIGPGLAGVGPTMNFSAYSVFSKFILMFDMLAGRLELFPIIVLLAPSTWRKR